MFSGAAARPPEVLRLVAAVAGADTHVVGGLDHVAGALMIQDVQGGCRPRAARRECRLVGEDTSQLRLPVGEQVEDELVLDRDVLVEQLAQQPLVDVVADAHHRELEEARHGRRQHEHRALWAFHVEQDRPRRQGVERRLRVRRPHLPRPRRLSRGERPDRQLRHQAGLALADEHLQDPVQQLGRWSALGKAVQSLDQCWYEPRDVTWAMGSSAPTFDWTTGQLQGRFRLFCGPAPPRGQKPRRL